jgi:predicted regulator of Ras-like GTPase activity (Roadblock/LC7/MglB family)
VRSNSVFRDALESLRDRIEGTIAVSLISLDGIPIEAISDGSVPLDVIGAEFGGFIKSVRLSNTDLNTGDVLQLSLVTEKYITLLSEVTPEYFLLLVMRPDGNYGRARHELAKAKYSLRDELV